MYNNINKFSVLFVFYLHIFSMEVVCFYINLCNVFITKFQCFKKQVIVLFFEKSNFLFIILLFCVNLCLFSSFFSIFSSISFLILFSCLIYMFPEQFLTITTLFLFFVFFSSHSFSYKFPSYFVHFVVVHCPFFCFLNNL